MSMHGYNYLLCFLGGAFIANSVPHFVRGITGAEFPTPFAKPPGRGMSSASVNVVWALINAVGAYLVLKAGNFSISNEPTLIIAFAGFAVASLLLSRAFGKRTG